MLSYKKTGNSVLLLYADHVIIQFKAFIIRDSQTMTYKAQKYAKYKFC